MQSSSKVADGSARSYWGTVKGLRTAVRLFGLDSNAAAVYAAELTTLQEAAPEAIQKAITRDLARFYNRAGMAAGLATAMCAAILVLASHGTRLIPRDVWFQALAYAV